MPKMYHEINRENATASAPYLRQDVHEVKETDGDISGIPGNVDDLDGGRL